MDSDRAQKIKQLEEGFGRLLIKKSLKQILVKES